MFYKGAIPAGTDWNTLITGGIYHYAQNLYPDQTNTPDGAWGWGILIVLQSKIPNQTIVTQIFIPIMGNDLNRLIYIRSSNPVESKINSNWRKL